MFTVAGVFGLGSAPIKLYVTRAAPLLFAACMHSINL